MTTSKHLPVALTRMVDATLEPGEHVVWTGRPRASRLAIAAVIGMAFGVTFWLGTSSWFADVEASLARLIFVYLTLLFSVAPYLILFIEQCWEIRNTCYIITDRRALAFFPRLRGGYRVFVNLPEDLAHVRCTAFFNRFGSIFWVEHLNSKFGGLVGRWRGGFLAITNPRDVLELMYDTFLPLLASRLQGDDPDARRKAAASVARMGPSAEKALPYLVMALRCEDSFVRDRAAHALGRLEKGGEAAIPALERALLIDESRKVAETARKAIGRIRLSIMT